MRMIATSKVKRMVNMCLDRNLGGIWWLDMTHGGWVCGCVQDDWSNRFAYLLIILSSIVHIRFKQLMQTMQIVCYLYGNHCNINSIILGLFG